MVKFLMNSTVTNASLLNKNILFELEMVISNSS